LSKAFKHAQSLATESNYLSKDTVGSIISIEEIKAQNVANKLKNKGYSFS
jgi:large subunit ribosomal protein L10